MASPEERSKQQKTRRAQLELAFLRLRRAARAAPDADTVTEEVAKQQERVRALTHALWINE